MTNEQYFKAKFFVETKKYGYGLKYINSLLAESPEDDILHAFLASNFQGLRKFEEAYKAISKAINLNPSEYRYYKTASKIQILMQNPEKAKELLDVAMGINPNDPDLFGYMSLVQTSFYGFERSLALADDGLKIAPDNMECLRAKALALTFLKRNDKAKEVTKKLLSNNPVNAQNLFTDGLVSLFNGEDSSKSLISLSLEKEPNNLHFRNAYRLSLRNELFGFPRLQKVIENVGRRGSIEANTFGFTYAAFFALCAINLIGMELGLENAISWLILYLMFWNINLIFHLIIAVQIPLYDAWLFLCNQKSRNLFSSVLKLKTLLIILLMITSFGYFTNAIYFSSINSYMIALHLGVLISMVCQFLYFKNRSVRWSSGFLVVGLLLSALSMYAFYQNLYYFIIINIVFRILFLVYIRLNKSKSL